ncbi:unnamed protein product, partial [Sphacelaria rigidula]
KIVANRLCDFCEGTDVFPEEQCGFRRQRSTIDMMFVVRRLQELGRKILSSYRLLIISLVSGSAVPTGVCLYLLCCHESLRPSFFPIASLFFI